MNHQNCTLYNQELFMNFRFCEVYTWSKIRSHDNGCGELQHQFEGGLLLSHDVLCISEPESKLEANRVEFLGYSWGLGITTSHGKPLLVWPLRIKNDTSRRWMRSSMMSATRSAVVVSLAAFTPRRYCDTRLWHCHGARYGSECHRLPHCSHC